MQNDDDGLIVIQCQKGELDCFGELYEKYVKKIYDFIYYKTLHKDTAEDLVSQTFFKALESIKKFDATKGIFSGWLYKIARNVVIDHWRSKKDVTDIEDVWGLSSDENVNSEVDAKIQLENVSIFLKKLSPSQREIIILKIWEDLPYKEISEIVGKSEASCKMMFSRSIKQIREEELLALIMLIMIAGY